MGVTIKDIARKAGVSTATVSRVLNNSKFVSEDLRKRVMAVVEENGYKPNVLARGLIKKQTHLIGVVLPDISNETFAALINGVEMVAKEKGFAIIVSNSHGEVEHELEILELFREKQLDGIIFSGVTLEPEHERFFMQYKIPTVLVGQTFPQVQLPSVNINNFQAAYDATKYLIELGHRQIAMITGPMRDASAGRDRYWGYAAALKEYNLTEHDGFVQHADFTIGGGYRAMQEILAFEGDPATAVFAASDRMAIGAMNCCLDHGLQIPEDVSIVGFDGTEMGQAVRPRLTTVVQDHAEIGSVAAQLLIDRLEGRSQSVCAVQVPYRFQEGGSSSPPQRRRQIS